MKKLRAEGIAKNTNAYEDEDVISPQHVLFLSTYMEINLTLLL